MKKRSFKDFFFTKTPIDPVEEKMEFQVKNKTDSTFNKTHKYVFLIRFVIRYYP